MLYQNLDNLPKRATYLKLYLLYPHRYSNSVGFFISSASGLIATMVPSNVLYRGNFFLKLNLILPMVGCTKGISSVIRLERVGMVDIYGTIYTDSLTMEKVGSGIEGEIGILFES